MPAAASASPPDIRSHPEPHPRRHDMTDQPFNRRRFLESSAGAATVTMLGAGTALFSPLAQAQAINLKPEKGAKLRVLRWSRFVQGDIDAYMANVKKFIDKTGIEVRIDNEGWEDVDWKSVGWVK